MEHKLGFKKHFLIETYRKELLVFLLSEEENFVLKGKIYAELAPLLDGTRNADEIVDTLMPGLAPAEIYYAISMLEKKGYIAELEGKLPVREIAYWHQMGVSDQGIKETLANTTVCVRSFSSVAISSLLSAVRSLGMNVVTEDASSEHATAGNIISLYIVDDYLQPELEEINREALQNSRPWMIMKPVGSTVWLGPIFIPGVTGCWECLADRLRTKRDIHLFIQTEKNTSNPLTTSFAALPSTLEIAWQSAAQQIALWTIKGELTPLAGKIVNRHAIMTHLRP